MAKRSLSNTSWAAAPVADTTAFTTLQAQVLQGGSGTQRINIIEVYLGGQHTASAANYMVLARDSTAFAATVSLGTNAKDAALDASTAALTAPPIVGNTTSGVFGQRSSTLYLLQLSFNAFGGIVRWVAAPGEEPNIIGNTASLGEVTLSAFTGSAAGSMASHIIYEPF